MWREKRWLQGIIDPPSYVVVLAVVAAGRIRLQELWVSFRTNQHHICITARDIAASIGPRKSQSTVHAFIGCDTVSSFITLGKKSAWDTWKVYEEATSTFEGTIRKIKICGLACSWAILLRFTILLYDRTSEETNQDRTQQVLLSRKTTGL